MELKALRKTLFLLYKFFRLVIVTMDSQQTSSLNSVAETLTLH